MSNRVHSRGLRIVFGALMCAAILAGALPASAAKYFDKDDEAAFGHLSNALSAWYESNQLGMPNSEADMNRVLALLNRVHSECALVPDKTLKKIDEEFAVQWRQNLQQGARQYEAGLRAYMKAAKNRTKPSPADQDLTNEGQQKILRFHSYYNANIERIVKKLQAQGVELFG